MKEVITLKNDAIITIRLLQKDDEERLFNYFSQLSAESKSRFGPHLFDRETVRYIVNEQGGNIFRYVALDKQQEIVAYMLIKKGMLEGEQYRLRQNNVAFEEALFCTYAPSVADAWQSSGLGSAMYRVIEQDIRDKTPYRFIILWGGVQATNAKAIGFYQKQGFQQIGSFWYDGKDNYDMIKSLY
jgi:ribosomal protein S18 acetylase RimI-like enzyme